MGKIHFSIFSGMTPMIGDFWWTCSAGCWDVGLLRLYVGIILLDVQILSTKPQKVGFCGRLTKSAAWGSFIPWLMHMVSKPQHQDVAAWQHGGRHESGQIIWWSQIDLSRFFFRSFFGNSLPSRRLYGVVLWTISVVGVVNVESASRAKGSIKRMSKGQPVDDEISEKVDGFVTYLKHKKWGCEAWITIVFLSNLCTKYWYILINAHCKHVSFLFLHNTLQHP